MQNTKNGFGVSSALKPKKLYGRVTIKIYPLGTRDLLRTSINMGVKDSVTKDTYGKDMKNWDEF